MSIEHNKTIARRFFEEFIEDKYDVHENSFARHLAFHFQGVPVTHMKASER